MEDLRLRIKIASAGKPASPGQIEAPLLQKRIAGALLFGQRVTIIKQKMVRKRYQEAKTGIAWLKSVDYDKYLSRAGVGKRDYPFWKQIGKGLISAYALVGACWWYNETSPLGWWTLKPMPEEEKELAHLYERREFPYPGDTEAMEAFIAGGGMIGTAIGPKGVPEFDKDAVNYHQELQDKKLHQEARKLWFRMRSEVVSELQDKGFDVE